MQRDSTVTLLSGYLLNKRDKNVKDVPNKLMRIMYVDSMPLAYYARLSQEYIRHYSSIPMYIQQDATLHIYCI